MITNEQLRIAADLATALVDEGATWPQLRTMQRKRPTLAQVVSVLQHDTALSILPEKKPVRRRSYDHTALRDILPDTTIGTYVHERLRRSGIWYIEDLAICHRHQLVALLDGLRPGMNLKVLEALMDDYGVRFCPVDFAPQEFAEQVYGSLEQTPIRMALFVSREPV